MYSGSVAANSSSHPEVRNSYLIEIFIQRTLTELAELKEWAKAPFVFMALCPSGKPSTKLTVLRASLIELILENYLYVK